MVERKVAIVTDVAADLPSNEILKERYNIDPILQVPLSVTFKSGDCTTNYIIGEDLDNDLFRNLVLREKSSPPKTSAVGPWQYEEIYREAKKGGLEILSIHLAEKLSSVIDSAKLAAKEMETGVVKIYDSETVSMAQGFMVIEAEKAAAAGLSRDEIIKMLDEIKKRTFLRAITPNIEYLKNSGRVSHLIGDLLTRFEINPVLGIDHSKVKKIALPKSKEGAINFIINFSQKKEGAERIAVLDFDAERDADCLMEGLLKLGVSEKIIYRGELGPVTASHGGPGTLAMVIERRTTT